MRTRQQPRKAIDTTGHYRTLRGMQWDVRLADISQGGCRICEPRGELRTGETIKLFIGGSGPHRARVMWRDGEDVGVHFERPLTPVLLDQIRTGDPAPAGAGYAAQSPAFGQRTGLGPLRPV